MPDNSRASMIDGMKASRRLETGYPVPQSGIYGVSHAQHYLPAEVTLLRDQTFPRCSRCRKPVFYELLRAAPSGVTPHPSTFAVALYELPELDYAEEASLR